MRKALVLAALVSMASSPAALAESNSGLAGAMADALKGGAATIGRDLGSKGKGTASAVSGDGIGGWGNIGSRQGVAGAGGQVSDRDDGRGQ